MPDVLDVLELLDLVDCEDEVLEVEDLAGMFDDEETLSPSAMYP